MALPSSRPLPLPHPVSSASAAASLFLSRGACCVLTAHARAAAADPANPTAVGEEEVRLLPLLPPELLARLKQLTGQLTKAAAALARR